MILALDASTIVLIDLASVPLTYAIGVSIGRALKRRFGVRLGVAYQAFCICFALWFPLTFRRNSTVLPSLFAWLPEAERNLLAAVLLLGSVVLIALIRRLYWELWFEKKHETQAPKFLSEVASLVIFVAALLGVTRFVYGQAIAGLALGSTVVAAILGFALQDLLGNIIAGISLEIGKPFRTGDWLAIDNQHAQVIEVNWRSTRLRTNDNVSLDIPNKLIVGSKIVNLTYPTREHALRIQLGFEYGAPPNMVKDCLVRAAANAANVLRKPGPKAYLKDYLDCAILYEVKFWIEDEAFYNEIMDSVRTNIWYEANRNHLRIPFPIRTIQIERKAAHQGDESLETARACVRKLPFFQLLEEEQIDRILRNSHAVRFGRGERVIEQGADGQSMFLPLAGEADVYVHTSGLETKVATLKTGDYCGEMSLLTGEPRSATVVARTDCEMCEVHKSVLGVILQENEALVRKLGEILAHRRMENEGILASSVTPEQKSSAETEYTERFLKRLYSFFEL